MAVHHCRCAFLWGFYPEVVEGFFCTSKRKYINNLNKVAGDHKVISRELATCSNQFLSSASMDNISFDCSREEPFGAI